MNTDVHIFTNNVTVVCLFPSNGMVCHVLGYTLSSAIKIKKNKVKKLLSDLENRVVGLLPNLRCLALHGGLTFFRHANTV